MLPYNQGIPITAVSPKGRRLNHLRMVSSRPAYILPDGRQPKLDGYTLTGVDEALAVVRAIEDEQAAEHRRIAIRAARLCLEQTMPLVASDTAGHGYGLAEEMQLAGFEARTLVVELALTAGASEDDLRYLIMCRGPNGSDRMMAAWWYCVRVRLARYHDIRAILDHSIADLVANDVINAEWARVYLDGYNGDTARARQAALARLNRERARLFALAKEDDNGSN